MKTTIKISKTGSRDTKHSLMIDEHCEFNVG